MDKVQVKFDTPPPMTRVGSTAELFDKPYFKARDDFRAYSGHFAAKHPGGITGAIPVSNKEGDDLTVDYLVLPAKSQPKNLVYISSGVHGSEAPTGSAMMEMFFRENLPNMDLSSTTVVMVHSYNPWGHLHNFRNTADNRDATRNNLKSAEDFQSYPPRDYDLVRGVVSAAKAPPFTFAQSFTAAAAGMVGLLFKTGFDMQRIVKSYAEGQVDDPKGVNYAGRSHLPQRAPLMEALQPHFEKAENIYHFDIHTGLGETGVLHMINQTEDKDRKASKEFIASFADGESIKYADVDTPNFYDTSFGDFTNNTEVMAGTESKVFSYTAEVGTLGISTMDKIVTAARSKERNQLHFFSDRVSEGKKEAILTRTTDLFDPQDSEWRQDVVDSFRVLWSKAEEVSRKA